MISQVNQLQQDILSHPNSRLLTQLMTRLMGALRTRCNALIPLASGFYVPHHDAATVVELVHVTGHVAGHAVHHISSLHHYVDAITTGIPILGWLLTCYEIWHEHQQLHHVEEAVGKLAVYSDNQRDAIYRYVVASTLLAFSHNIESNPLLQWDDNLLLEILFCLPALHESEQIHSLAQHWRKAIITNTQPLGVTMPHSTQNTALSIYTKTELRVAWEVQRILTSNHDDATVAEHLALPPMLDFLHNFHSRIYQEVLGYYDHRANSNAVETYLCWYTTEEWNLLKKSQSALIHALKVINDELTPLEGNNDPTYALQLNLINTCLFSKLNAMSLAMPWHVAQRLFISTASRSPKLSCTRQPLIEVIPGGDDLRIVSLEGQLEAANARAATATADAADATARAAAADARAAAADARFMSTADLLDSLMSKMSNEPSSSASVTTQGMFAIQQPLGNIQSSLDESEESKEQLTNSTKSR